MYILLESIDPIGVTTEYLTVDLYLIVSLLQTSLVAFPTRSFSPTCFLTPFSLPLLQYGSLLYQHRGLIIQKVTGVSPASLISAVKRGFASKMFAPSVLIPTNVSKS